jgi:hypothetical protein
VRELTDDGAGVRIANEEAHEAQAVVLALLVRWKEQIACEIRHGCDHRIRRHDRATLCDLDPLVQIHPRILATDDVLGRRKETPEAEGGQPDRDQDRQARLPRARSEPQIESGHETTSQRDDEVRDDQVLEAIAARRREREDRRE